jgi:hypothetical protein
VVDAFESVLFTCGSTRLCQPSAVLRLDRGDVDRCCSDSSEAAVSCHCGENFVSDEGVAGLSSAELGDDEGTWVSVFQSAVKAVGCNAGN